MLQANPLTLHRQIQLGDVDKSNCNSEGNPAADQRKSTDGQIHWARKGKCEGWNQLSSEWPHDGILIIKLLTVEICGDGEGINDRIRQEGEL